jgi:hypothetical protein
MGLFNRQGPEVHFAEALRPHVSQLIGQRAETLGECAIAGSSTIRPSKLAAATR